MEGFPKKNARENLVKRLQRAGRAAAFGAAITVVPVTEGETGQKSPSIEQHQSGHELVDDFFDKAVSADIVIDDARGRRSLRTKISIWFDAIAPSPTARQEARAYLMNKIHQYDGERTPGLEALYDVLRGIPVAPAGKEGAVVQPPSLTDKDTDSLQSPEFPGKRGSEVRRIQNNDW